MQNERQQLWLRLATQSLAMLSPEAERELVQTLADLLLEVARAGSDREGGQVDDHEDR